MNRIFFIFLILIFFVHPINHLKSSEKLLKCWYNWGDYDYLHINFEKEQICANYTLHPDRYMLTRVCDIISNEKFTKNYIEFSKILGLGILEVKMPSMKFYIKERIDRDLKKINRYNKKSFLEYNDISDFIPYKLWFIETFFIDWTIWSTNNCNVMDITKFKFVDKEYKDIK